MEAKQSYLSRLEALTAERKKLLKKKTVFGIMRFGTIAALIALFYFLWSAGPVYTVTGATILAIIFVRLVYRDLDNRAAIDHLSHLITINEGELKALDGEYYHFKDGTEHMLHDHAYANDMDILGHASLFQLINRTTSEPGSWQLADWLLSPAGVREVINRQDAIKELKPRLEWRQQFQAYGTETSITGKTIDRLRSWLNEPTLFLQFRPWQWLRYVLPLIICTIVALYIFDIVSISTLLIFLLIYAVLAYQINKVISPLHERLSKMVDELDTLSNSIRLVEGEQFETSLLNQLKANIIHDDKKASATTKQLKQILDRLDIRYNIILSAPLNLLLLWNLQQVLSLEKWKKLHTADVDGWFATLAVFEALNSFATIHFNNPGWCFPILEEKTFFITAKSLGHPLIHPTRRVDNFIEMEQDIMLVTGSNMAGKSTYLRSIGTNAVLAMAGAPVCASAFHSAPIQLVSSMRIADNLEESTSTFYAELKKLKTIIDKVNEGENVFVLLDEILRGTNSLDRHTGSEALIRQLIRHHTPAVIATHDIDLAKLQQEYPDEIKNYHFDVQVQGEELFFDYKLKPGICSSMNASILMKKIGIEL